MGIQHITRKNAEATVENIFTPNGKNQISYNSDGHLVIRNYWENSDGDILLVLDERISKSLISFILKVFGGKGENSDIPF